MKQAKRSTVAGVQRATVNYNVVESQRQRIFLQRYIAHFPDGIQVWSEWRRSCDLAQPNPVTGLAGVPALMPSAFATNSSKGIPRRYVYGINEYSTNGANVADAAGRLTGGDVFNARIWWDK